jgi:hypothetical protein
VTRIRAFISSRPVLAVVLTAVLALVLGAGAGAAGPTDEVSELKAEAADLREQLADAESDSETAWNAADAATSEVEAAEADVSAAQDRVDELRAEAQSAQAEAQSAEEPTAVSTEPTDSYEADGYTFSDVQITKDSINEFEVQARVTNNGGTGGMRFIDASVFAAGSVVATAEGMERIDPGETVTVELISTDKFDEGWDEVEFSVDRW